MIKLLADYNTNTLLDPNVVQCYFTCLVFRFIEFSACADIYSAPRRAMGLLIHQGKGREEVEPSWDATLCCFGQSQQNGNNINGGLCSSHDISEKG